MKPKVNIIIPVYNNSADTKKCLVSLSKLVYSKNRIIINIIDNASTDDTLKAIASTRNNLRHLGLKIKTIINKKNLGFAGAVNQGIRARVCDYYFVINNDITFAGNHLQTLIEYIENHPQVGIIGGKVYYQKPKGKLLFSGLKFDPWTGSIIRLPDSNSTKESGWIQGCDMLIAKKVIDKIGYFDEDYFFSFEDTDFCQRANRAGFKIIYFPKAIAWHKESGTIDTFGQSRKAYELYKAKFTYIFKRSSLAQIFSSILVQFLVVAPYRRLFLRDKYFFFGSLYRAFVYNLSQLPTLIQKR